MEVRTTSILGSGISFKHRGKDVLVPLEIAVEVLGLPWRVGFVLSCAGDVPAITRLTIEQVAGGPAVGANTIRSVPLGQAVERAIDQAATPIAFEGGRVVVTGFSVPTGVGHAATSRRGRRTITDADMKRTAALHAQAVREQRRDQLLYIAEGLHVSRATAARWRDRARRLGFITDAEGDTK